MSSSPKVSPSLPRLIVIGNGMVSFRFCQEMAKRKGTDSFHITIFGEEPRPAYDRVHLTKHFDLRNETQLALAPKSWYLKNGFNLITDCRVVSIDRERKTVTDQSGTSHPYDFLVLATGSAPFVPPIEGSDSPQVFVYRTIEDCDAIIGAAKNKRHATVLGGGLLGLEAANALRELGLKTSVVEFANGLMPRQLSQEASRTLEQSIRDLGVNLLLGTGAQKIEPHEDRLRLSFADQTSFDTDLLVIATGIRPRDELARSAEINLGARGGIVVNDSLQSSDQSIFAIGECALHRGQIYGFVAPGYQMAECLADRFLGGDATFQGADTSSRLKLLGISVSAFGDNLGEGKLLVYRSASVYRAIVLRRDRLVGGTVVGEWDQTAQLQLAITDERFMSPSDQSLFEREGRLDVEKAIANWPAHAIVCNCTQTSRGTLSACLAAGCSSSKDLSEKTGAGTVCGSCRPLLAQLAGETGEEAAYRPRGRKLLSAFAVLALIASSVFLLRDSLPPPQSVQTAYYQISQLWDNSLHKQISGYTMAGLSLLALLLSARKRIRFFRMGDYGLWRAVHSVLGVTCLIALVAHTGFDFGQNLNLWLMTCFVGLNLAGAVAGLTIAMEDRFTGPWSRRIRSLTTKAHILFFWPYPVLLGFHIYKAYAY